MIIPTTREKIMLGICEIIAGMRLGDEQRSAHGQDIVEATLATLPAPAIDPNLLWELHQAGTEMLEVAVQSGTRIKSFLEAKSRFQIALSKIRGGK